MKTFFMKIFMVVAAGLCLFEGLVLLAVGLGRSSPEQLLAIYTRLMASPKILSVVWGVGIFFVVLGFILLIVSSRTKPAPKMIMVEKDGRSLGIPQQTVSNFIHQIMEQNPYASDITVLFEPKDDKVEIMIASAFNGVPSVHREINRIEEILKTEIENVFGWKGFNIHFRLRGVRVNPKKKYFSSANGEKKGVAGERPEAGIPIAEPQALSVSAGKEKAKVVESQLDEDEFNDDDEAAEELAPQDDTSKGNSLLSKMLWRK